MNARDTKYVYQFEDGGFEIYSDNYFFHSGLPGHGTFVVGFKAFRWLLGQLGIKQPRRFKNELSSDFTVTTFPRVQKGVDKTPASRGINNWFCTNCWPDTKRMKKSKLNLNIYLGVDLLWKIAWRSFQPLQGHPRSRI